MRKGNFHFTCNVLSKTKTLMILAHWGLVTPYVVTYLGQHWFRNWQVTYSTPNRHLNQCWIIFEVKWIFEMLTVRGQQHSFSTHGRCSCECVKAVETENVSSWVGLEPPTFGFMPNALTIWAIRARYLPSHVFEHWFWRYRWGFFIIRYTPTGINASTS